MKLKVYIAGKISANSVFGTHDWRDAFCAELSAKVGYEVVNLDPTKIYTGFDLDQGNSELIFGRNSFMQKSADLTIVYLSDDISVGGSQEMLIAKYLGKPLIGIAAREGKFNKSQKELLGKTYKNFIDPYVRTSCDVVVEDLDQLADYLKNQSNLQNIKPKTIQIIDSAIEHYEKEFLQKDSYVRKFLE